MNPKRCIGIHRAIVTTKGTKRLPFHEHEILYLLNTISLIRGVQVTISPMHFVSRIECAHLHVWHLEDVSISTIVSGTKTKSDNQTDG